MSSPPFSRILIANRGEIAVRIIKTCRRMGISTIAVYSTPDSAALHVQMADEAYHIGPAPALESYLNIENILRAARAGRADAVHPGYGFLAENPSFAKDVVDSGMTWIGPPPSVIALLGDKVASKRLAEEAGVPVISGYAGEDRTPGRMQREAEALGFPVMLKASAGGGGKGMRAVTSPRDLGAELEGAMREARAAFGDDRVFLEKLIVNPRHVEIQVLLDQHGSGIYLGERECSIQRRHQKVLEEAPSPVLTPELRAAMGEDALRLARASGYTNAGTVEFLFAADGYYFLEMNTRIQVEHPVTEMVTGLDIVEEQIRIAADEYLRVAQSDVALQGHAVEVRLYAEDPDRDFLPSAGTIDVFEPPSGPGVRNDVGVLPGSEVGTSYDPMLAKLIVHAANRQAAVARLKDALNDYALSGPTTNLAFLRWLVDQEDVRLGRADIGYLDRAWPPEGTREASKDALIAGALYLATASDGLGGGDTDLTSPWRLRSGWRHAAAGRTFRFGGDDRVDVTPTDSGTWLVNIGDVEPAEVTILSGAGSPLILRRGVEIQRFEINRVGEGLAIDRGGKRALLQVTGSPDATARQGRGARNADAPTAPMPGTIVKVSVSEGQQVVAHEALVILEAMKMEHVVEAPHDGTVARVLVREGDLVAAGTPLIEMAEE